MPWRDDVHALGLEHMRALFFGEEHFVELLARAQPDKRYRDLFAIAGFLDEFAREVNDKALLHLKHEYLSAVHEPHSIKDKFHCLGYLHKKAVYTLVGDGYRTALFNLAPPQMRDRTTRTHHVAESHACKTCARASNYEIGRRNE